MSNSADEVSTTPSCSPACVIDEAHFRCVTLISHFASILKVKHRPPGWALLCAADDSSRGDGSCFDLNCWLVLALRTRSKGEKKKLEQRGGSCAASTLGINQRARNLEKSNISKIGWLFLERDDGPAALEPARFQESE